jgi:hypothetical protein
VGNSLIGIILSGILIEAPTLSVVLPIFARQGADYDGGIGTAA